MGSDPYRPDYGPNHAAVEGFLASVRGMTDAELWSVEESVGAPPEHVSATRPLAESSDRLLAWYEAAHYAELAPRLHGDGTLRQEYPGQALVSSFRRVKAVAVCVAQALVVRDLLDPTDFARLVEGWPGRLP